MNDFVKNIETANKCFCRAMTLLRNLAEVRQAQYHGVHKMVVA